MTIEQKQKFEKLIVEYQTYIENSPDEKTRRYYSECLEKIMEFQKLMKLTTQR